MDLKALKKGYSATSGSSHFRHKPLDTTTTSIRVVRILPGEDGTTIQCLLEHRPLTMDQYVCLSYMWADEHFPAHILVNQQRLSIRRNLYSFLKYARRTNICDWLWIDAICIDQQNVQERNLQVQRMSQIYKQASVVLVWPKSVGSIENIGSERSIFRKALRTKLASRMLFSHRAREILNSTSDLESPYWCRLCIVQEIFQARRIVVVLGSSLHLWEWLPHRQSVRLDLSFGKNWYQSKQPFLDLRQYTESRLGFVPDDFLTFSLRGYDGVEPQDELLSICRDRICTDVRDRWLGILGLIPGGVQFPVDYTVELPTLTLDAFEHVRIHLSDRYRRKQKFVGQRTYVDDWGFVSRLATAFGLSCMAFCLRCAQRHQRVPSSNIPPELKDHDRRGKTVPYLWVVITQDEVDLWRTGAQKSTLNMLCTLCCSVPNHDGRYTIGSTRRVTSDMIWCLPEPIGDLLAGCRMVTPSF